MHDSYIIQGGVPLSGEVSLSGAKNASIKLMIASVLFDSPVVLHNVPHNADNKELISLLRDIGVTVHVTGNTITLDSSSVCSHEINLLYGSKVRSSFLLFGPLLHRFGKARIPNPGGCRIGARPIERIINGIRALGVEVSYDHDTGFYDAALSHTIAGEYTFEKPTHTGTEALLLLAVCGTGNEVVLHNCALEPEIDDLITFLNNAGAAIVRNKRDIHITPVPKLKQKEPHTVIEDRNEAVTYAAMAYATHGDIFIPNLNPHLVTAFIEKIRQAGGAVTVNGERGVRFTYTHRLNATNIETGVHPGYMTDWQPQWGLIMATATGESVIHETMLEARLNYVQELQKVGAQMELFQPEVTNPEKVYQFNYDPSKTYTQAVRIAGVDSLHNGVMYVHDIRAGAVVVIAALSAVGESVIHGVHQLERGYEHLSDKIRALGGKIELI